MFVSILVWVRSHVLLERVRIHRSLSGESWIKSCGHPVYSTALRYLYKTALILHFCLLTNNNHHVIHEFNLFTVMICPHQKFSRQVLTLFIVGWPLN
jgi:hypothetical protein